MKTYHQDGTLPEGGEIFVFGSNLLGHHAGGAARVAVEKYGATPGRYAGRQGRSYAIPTANKIGDPLSLTFIALDTAIFIKYARENRHLDFFVTRIGCGIIGYTDHEIAPMFKDAPPNVSLPLPWKEWIEEAHHVAA